MKALVSQARAESEPFTGRHGYDESEHKLSACLQEAQTAFHAALCDSFNTPVALDVLRDIISKTNVYVNSRGKNLNLKLVERIARWVGQMLRMFGLGEGRSSEIGWGQERGEEGNMNADEILMPYLRILSSFRDGVRLLAIDKSESALKDILSLSDKLRDEDLVPLGVALDDQEDGKALVKLVNPGDLIKAREEKRAQQEAKAAKKAANMEAERQKKMQKLEKGRVSPHDLFKPPNVLEGTYGSWNGDGVPTTDGEGKELSKSQVKRIQKEWSNQKKLHEEYLEWSGR